MNKVKILHCGDMHFDTPFSDLDKGFSERRREDLRETFGRIIDRAKVEDAQIILIAGDLFDNISITKNTLDYIKNKVEEIKPIRVFISPGNHDPYNEKSYYSVIEWPDNLHIFKNEFEKIYIEELNLNIYGIGFSKPYERESLLKDFNNNFSVEEDKINIMVIHGDIASKGSTNEYNPLTLEEIGDSKMDYIALGHRHSFSGILREKNTYYAYSGNPEGRAFDELGEKGVIIGEVGKNYVDLHFKKLCKRMYLVQSVNISFKETKEEIIAAILENISENARKDNLYKIILQGEIHKDFIINKTILEESLREYFYYVKLEDSTSFKIDFNTLSKELSLKGIFVKKMLDKMEQADEQEKDRLMKALNLGILALEGKEVDLDED